MGLHKEIAKQVKGRRSVMKDTTIRDFSGGLNVIDNDLNLNPKFAKQLTNLYRRPDGSLGLRYGTARFTNLAKTTQDTFLLPAFNQSGLAPNTPSFLAVVDIDTTLGSAIVTLTMTEAGTNTHTLVPGEWVSAPSITTGGIAGSQLGSYRQVHTVPAVDKITIVADIVATSTATSSGGTLTQDLVLWDVAKTQYAASSDVIIGTEYFQDHIIAATSAGEVFAIDSLGRINRIWSTAIAAKQSGAPSGWSTGLTFCTFAIHTSVLMISNGTDKPLVVDLLAVTNGVYCQYSVDLGTSSNTNTPVGRYVTAADRYVVVAGDPLAPDRLHISNIDTYGTFLGDAAPNDAIQIDMSKRVPTIAPTIRGISWFRNRLIVSFDDGTATIQLGVYTADATPLHVPVVEEYVSNVGCIAHKSMVSIGDDFFQADHIGVPSLKQAQFTGGVRNERVSQLIDPEVQAQIYALSVAQTEDKVFALFNSIDNQYMLFIPNAAETARSVFVYTVIRTLKVAAWAKFEGWNFAGGCTSLLGRVFLYEGTKISVYGTAEDPVFSDFTDPTIGYEFSGATGHLGLALANYGATPATATSWTLALAFILPSSGACNVFGYNSNTTDFTGAFGLQITTAGELRIIIRQAGSTSTAVYLETAFVFTPSATVVQSIMISVTPTALQCYINHQEITVFTVVTPTVLGASYQFDHPGIQWGVTKVSAGNTQTGFAMYRTLLYAAQALDLSLEANRYEIFGPNNEIVQLLVQGALPSGLLTNPVIWQEGNITVGAAQNNKSLVPSSIYDTAPFLCIDATLDAPSAGDNIVFTWELPWGDFDARVRTKMLEYLQWETSGLATFTIDTYVDNYLAAAALSMEFIGGDAVSGRTTNDERLWKWPVKGKIFKHIITGSTYLNIRFISLSMLYRAGSIRR